MTMLVGSGTSHLDDAYQAGATAARQAVLPLGNHSPRLVLAFTAARYDQAAIARGIRSVTGDVPLMGCGAGGVIGTDGPDLNGVNVVAFYAEDMDVNIAVDSGVRDQPAHVAERVADQLERYLPPPTADRYAAALVLADGLSGSLAEAVQSATSVLGPLCPLVGGGAGALHPNQFVNDATYDDAIAIALLTTSAPIGVGVYHGWTPAGQGLVVTRSRHNMVYELGGRSAFEAYVELFPDEDLTPTTLYEFARLHPIGLPQVNGEFLIRDPVNTFANGAMECAASVPENAIAHIMQADPATLPTAAESATRRAIAKLGGRPVAAVLIFNCVTRQIMLGDAIKAEVDLIRGIIGPDTPIGGMFCFGEIAAGEVGPSTFHNKTVAVCAIARS